ncbi:HD domain-containing protein [Rapidithrix thailandica]|uniref:HD domain-containing protein n=1 Tax=Rapidithrix thailandica TaxID=413964 RepID=A0AAW9RXZ5_9BACT
MHRKKIINDPIYGFISIKTDLISQIVQHPYFQRLRRIKQLGLTDFVYPGALHTRFHHALGAMHLMSIALDALKNKGHKISKKEHEAAMAAILLHDIGHGPFSHALENTILTGAHHEHLSLLFMEKLNREFDGQLELAIQMFCNRYERAFFHQLISSQLDMDRLDYLQRDCFFTGVVEGKVAADRLIRMLNIHEDQIVVEEKGIYSIENFLTARRLMYWQVYLHKTTVSTEQMLIKIIQRARKLLQSGQEVFASPSLKTFLEKDIRIEDFHQNPMYIDAFSRLDDFDIWAGIKLWASHPDSLLRLLSNMLLDRKLFRVLLSNTPHPTEAISSTIRKIQTYFQIDKEAAHFLCGHGKITNAAYVANNQNIMIQTKKGELLDASQASDLPNIEALSKIVKKYYLCFPKVVSL